VAQALERRLPLAEGGPAGQVMARRAGRAGPIVERAAILGDNGPSLSPPERAHPWT